MVVQFTSHKSNLSCLAFILHFIYFLITFIIWAFIFIITPYISILSLQPYLVLLNTSYYTNIHLISNFILTHQSLKFMIISYIFHITTRTTFLFYLPSNFTILSSIFVTLFSGLHFFFHNYNYKIFFFYFVTSHLLSYFNSLFMNTLMVTLYEMEMWMCVCVCVYRCPYILQHLIVSMNIIKLYSSIFFS